MKKYIVTIIAVLLFAVLFVSPAYAQDEVPGVNLTFVQLVQLGTVASVLYSAFRFLAEVAAKAKLAIPKWVSQVIVFAVAGFLTALWFPVAFPAFPAWVDFSTTGPLYLAWLGSAYEAFVPSAFIAFKLYDYLLSKAREKLGTSLSLKGF